MSKLSIYVIAGKKKKRQIFYLLESSTALISCAFEKHFLKNLKLFLKKLMYF
jgi:hypothetical protein